MNFTISSDVFIQAVGLVAPMAGKKNLLMPERSGVQIEVTETEVTFSASNLEMWGRISAPLTSVTLPGAAIVSAELLRSITQAARGGDITVSADAKRMTLTAPAGTWRLPVVAPEAGFPRISLPDPATALPMTVGTLKRAILSSVFCVEKDNKRGYNGVQISHTPPTDGAAPVLEFAATDGSRGVIAQCPLPAPADGTFSVKVPAPFLEIVGNAIGEDADSPVTVLIGTEIGFDFGSLILGGRLLEGALPNVRGVVNQPFTYRCQVSGPAFEAALRRVRLVLDEMPVVLTFGVEVLTVSGYDRDGEGEVEVPVAWLSEGQSAMRMGIDPTFLLDYCKLAGEQPLILAVNDTDKHLGMRAETGPPYIMASKRIPAHPE